ncbi:MAG: hypothetical protein AAGE99_04845 [Chlamydiota bacterium]
MAETNDIKLEIKIDNTDPIPLNDFSLGLKGLRDLYSDFTKENKTTELLVSRIGKGSIVIELITTCCLSAIPLINDTNNIIQFVQNMKLLVGTLLKKPKQQLEEIKKEYCLPDPKDKDLIKLAGTFDLIRKKTDSLSASAININNVNVYNNCIFNGSDAEAMKKNLPTLPSKKGEETRTIKEKRMFKWEQTNHSNAKVGNKGLIESIHDKPVKVIFDDERIKQQMTTSDEQGDWHKKFYLVDVEVQYDGGKAKLYTVIKNHAKESFPIDE